MIRPSAAKWQGLSWGDSVYTKSSENILSVFVERYRVKINFCFQETIEMAIASVLSIRYNQWNEALFEHFYASANNRVVYLYCNERVISEIGASFGLNEQQALSSFCTAVCSWVADLNVLFRAACTRSKRWYEQGAPDYPPFIALLSLCVLAATKMEQDSDEHIGGGNYYYRLRQFLSLTDSQGMPSYFDETVDLWRILLKWQKDNAGKYGYTFSTTFSNKPYSGRPRSQCLIRDTEKTLLAEFFTWAGYEPGTPLQHETVREDLREYLTPRVGRLRRLFFQNTKGLREAIVNMVIMEFESWEPEYDQDSQKRTYEKVTLSAQLQYVGSIFRKQVKLSLISAPVLSDGQYLQEAGFELTNSRYHKSVESLNDLTQDVNLSINNHKLSYNGSDFIVFRLGHDYGIPGWLSRRDIAPGHQHLFLYSSKYQDIVSKLIVSETLSEADNTGVKMAQEGWKFTKVIVHDESIVSNELGRIGLQLRPARDTTLSFIGGLKTGHNKWLIGYGPHVSISAPPKTTLSINDIEILSLFSDGLHLNLNDFVTTTTTTTMNIHLGKQNYMVHLIEPSVSRNISQTQEPCVQFPPPYQVVGLTGLYCHHKIESLPKPYVMLNGDVILTAGNRHVSLNPSKGILNSQPFSQRIETLGPFVTDYSNLYFRPIDYFVDYLYLKGEGNWESFLRGIEACFDKRDPFVAYQVRRVLSELGIAEFTLEMPNTNRYRWRAVPVTGAVLPLVDFACYITGTMTKEFKLSLVKQAPKNIRIMWSIPKSDYEPISTYAVGDSLESLEEFLSGANVRTNFTEDYCAYDLIRSLPTIENFITTSPAAFEPLNTPFDGWNVYGNSWDSHYHSILGRYLLGYGQKLHLLFSKGNGLTKSVQPDVGKLYVASQHGLHLFSYSNYQFLVRQEYLLPDQYSRALVACSGQYPDVQFGRRCYRNVPGELALAAVFKMGFSL